MSIDRLNILVASLTGVGDQTEIVLPLTPSKGHIQPWLTHLTGRLLTWAEWQQAVELVETWYESVTDEHIAAHNETWLGQQYAKAGSQFRTAPKAKKQSTNGWIYILKGDRYYKIGRSVNPYTRVEQFTPMLPFPVEIVHTFAVEDMQTAEKDLHERFADKRTSGEWFTLAEADLEWIKALAVTEQTQENDNEKHTEP